MRNALVTDWMQEVDNMFRTFSPVLQRQVAQRQNEKSWFSPAVDVQETEKEYLFHFDLPGMADKDLTINVTGKELQVSGERLAESKEGVKAHRTERFFGRFHRSFVLPEEADSEKIEAVFKDGVLEIRVPKAEAAQPKTIPIRTH